MEIIPVLDLKGGQAVHAMRGERAHYQPVNGVLGRGEDVLALALAFRDRLGCQTIYLADLDAISGGSGHKALLVQLVTAGLKLWVDAGVTTVEQALDLADLGLDKIIIGSETLPALGRLATLAAAVPPAKLLLSVDLIGGVLQAPPDVREAADLLATAVHHQFAGAIVLDLARVGAATGPPLETAIAFQRTYPQLPIYVGGGVRHRADLVAAAAAGLAGVLVATAVHRGILTAADLHHSQHLSNPL
jgi:phosphoribosylformimino-5-aminoimidazole carboxamide ribotide isomerase